MQNYNQVDLTDTLNQNQKSKLAQEKPNPSQSNQNQLALQTDPSIKDRVTTLHYPPCTNCFEDAYEPELANTLYYILFDKFPGRINNINDQYTRYNIRKKMVRTKKCYTYQKCNLGNYHLVHLPKPRRIPMLLQIYDILKKAHGQEHNHSGDMKRFINRTNYYAFIAERYVHEFILNCSYCRKQKAIKIPKREDFFQNIYDRMRTMQEDRLIMEPEDENKPIPVFDQNVCFYDCTIDSYAGENLMIYEYLMFQKLPGEWENLYQNDRYELIRSFRFKKKRHSLIPCQNGTNHLWKTTSKTTEPTKNYRVPMERQKELLNLILHGKQHRPLVEMINILKTTFYCYFQTKQYLEKNFYFCKICEQKNEKNPIVKYKTKDRTKKRVYYSKDFQNIFNQEDQFSDSNNQQIQNQRKIKIEQIEQLEKTINTKMRLEKQKKFKPEPDPYKQSINFVLKNNKNIKNGSGNTGNTLQISFEDHQKMEQKKQQLQFDESYAGHYDIQNNSEQVKVEQDLLQNKSKNIQKSYYIPDINHREVADKHAGVPYKGVVNGKKSSILDQLLNKVQKQGGTVIKGHQNKNFNNNLTYIAIITKEMQQDYYQFGDCLYLDSLNSEPIDENKVQLDNFYTKNFNHVENANESNNQRVYVLSASDKSGHRRVCAVFLMKDLGFLSYFTVLEDIFMRFSEMCPPESIYIPSQDILTRALVSLVTYSQNKLRQLYILYNQQNELEELNKMIFKEEQKQFLLDCFMNCMCCRSRAQYEKNVERIKAFAEYPFSLDKLIEESHLLCYSQMTERYIGIEGICGLTDQQYQKDLAKIVEKCKHSEQKINALLKVSQRTFSRNKLNKSLTEEKLQNLSLLRKLQIKYRMTRRMKRKMNMGLINQYNDYPEHLFRKLQQEIPEQLQEIYPSTSDQIYNILLDQYRKSLVIETYINQSSPPLIQNTIDNGVEYTLYYDLAGEHWVCSCNRLEHVGIPCSHLMSILRKYRGSISYYVHERWRF